VSASGVAPRADDGPGPAVEAVPEPTLVPTATPAPAVLQLVGASFEFVEPPQPGATARLALTVRNPSTAPQGPLTVSLPQEWLAGYRVEGIVPLPTDGTLDGQRAAGQQRFALPAPEPGADQEVSFWVVTTAEVIDAPAARVLDAQGREIGRAQPVTEAPPPLAPGPVYSLEIPRLRIQTGVVQVDWEPPLFVVGQLKASAPVTQGNSVLVGHVRGAAGYNVFDHLNQVAVGDTVIAHSRGMAYEFVVRSTEILPPTDVTPTEPTDSPQLTLMTCAGDWNPLTQEYSERLWIVADPVGGPDQSAPARRASAPPSRAPAGAAAIAPGGLGASDQDLASTYAAPVGESATHLAVYRTRGGEHRARLVEVPGDVAASRASAVVLHAPDGAPWALDEAIRQSRELLPRDTQPRAVQPEGNQRFVVERFTSPALATLFPDGAFTPGRGAAGDLLVVYVRRSDGRIGDVVVGLGNSPDALLALL
jgi:LPXTG-site transpeptidase (sortase) family protein